MRFNRDADGKSFGRLRCAIVIVILLASRPALAESLNADAARGFVVGKLFAFNCFDGSRGAGRIYGDGSVVGTIQFQGVGPVEWVSLPSGTLKVKGEAVCASLDRLPIEPCFNLNRIDDQSFRGSIFWPAKEWALPPPLRIRPAMPACCICNASPPCPQDSADDALGMVIFGPLSDQDRPTRKMLAGPRVSTALANIRRNQPVAARWIKRGLPRKPRCVVWAALQSNEGHSS